MNERQSHLLRLLKEIDSFCREHDITYYCAAGTVLGAIRHGGFIPWDDDIDVYMLRSDYDKLIALACAFKEPYFLHLRVIGFGHAIFSLKPLVTVIF